MASSGQVLIRGSAENVALACLEFAGEQISAFNEVIPDALHGRRTAVKAYVQSWRILRDRLLTEVSMVRPDLVLRHEGSQSFKNVAGTEASYALRILDRRASDAPFSHWVNEFGTGQGISVTLVDQIRETLRDVRPLGSRPGGLPPWEINSAEFDRFVAMVEAELVGVNPPLEQIMSLFELNLTETAQLFRVSRQAISSWLESGEMPRFRRDKAYTVASIGRLLHKQLREGAVPVIVRRPAPAYKSRSILGAITEDDHEAVLESVRASFDWASLS